MSRDITAPVATAIAGTVVKYALFAEFEFASGTVRVWSGLGTKSWDSQSWSGSGDFGGVGPVEETTEVTAAGLIFTLSGIPNTTISLALGDHYRGKPCKLWLAFLDAADAVVDAYRMFAGRMDVMTIEIGTEIGTITVQAENRLIDLRRPRSLRYTDQEQQRLFAGDLGLEYVPKLAEKPIPWGMASAVSAPVYGGGSGDLTGAEY